MTVLMMHCNHWVGYHITKALLEADYQVDAMIDPSLDDHLSMFFGRNSQVRFVDRLEKKYDTAIIIGNQTDIDGLQTTKKLIIEMDKVVKNVDESTTVIRPPLLFGEWMPMNDTGCFHKNRFFSFDSEAFMNQALSIDVFSSLLVQWIADSRLPRYLDVHPKNGKEQQDNTVFVRERGSIEKQIDTLKQHYDKFRNFYK